MTHGLKTAISLSTYDYQEPIHPLSCLFSFLSVERLSRLLVSNIYRRGLGLQEVKEEDEKQNVFFRFFSPQVSFSRKKLTPWEWRRLFHNKVNLKGKVLWFQYIQLKPSTQPQVTMPMRQSASGPSVANASTSDARLVWASQLQSQLTSTVVLLCLAKSSLAEKLRGATSDRAASAHFQLSRYAWRRQPPPVGLFFLLDRRKVGQSFLIVFIINLYFNELFVKFLCIHKMSCFLTSTLFSKFCLLFQLYLQYFLLFPLRVVFLWRLKFHPFIHEILSFICQLYLPHFVLVKFDKTCLFYVDFIHNLYKYIYTTFWHLAMKALRK